MSQQWTSVDVEKYQTEIKHELEQVESTAGLDARLRHCMIRIQSLESDLSDDAGLRRFIYVVSALVHHRRHASLSKREAERLFELGKAILLAAGVKPQKSRIANLHGDLHRVMSQIYWEDGDHWGATLELLRARSLGFSSEQNSEEFDQLALAIRYERLGMLQFARRVLNDLSSDKLSDKNVGVKLTRLARICRTLNDRPGFDAVLKCDAVVRGGESLMQDLEFERILFDCRDSGDYSDLFSAVRKGKSHYSLPFILEARLYSLCIPTLRWIDEFPKVDALKRRVEFKKSADHYLMDVNRHFDTLMDAEFQNAAKVPAAFAVMIDARSVPNAITEMLCLVACYRWFLRRNLTEFAELVGAKYAQQSLIATDGESRDCLKLAGS